MRTQRAGQSALLLLDAIDILEKESIAYAVIGAMAASVHGVVRASVDADALLSVTVRQLGDLQQRFAAAGLVTDLRRGDIDDPIAAMLVLSDSFQNRVDLLVGLRGLEPEAFARAIEVPFKGARLRVVCIEDFIAMKVFAGGPQDIRDAERALAVANNSIDKDLLLRLAARYGRTTLEGLKKLTAT